MTEASISTNPNNIAAGRLLGAGLAIFPCDEQKRPLVKWSEESTCDLQQARALFKRAPGMPAIDLAKCGLVVLDCDRHGGPDGVAAFAELIARYGLPDGVPVVETVNNGRHYYFAQPVGVEPLNNSRGDLPAGIDVRGRGGYTIAPGAVRRDGRGWLCADGSPDLATAYAEGRIPPLPQWLYDIVRPPRSAPSTKGPMTIDNDASERDYLERALRYIPPDSRDDWLAVGAALHDAGHSWSFDLWTEWSRQSAKFDAQDQHNTWDSFARSYTGPRVNVGTIIERARRNGFDGRKSAQRVSASEAGPVHTEPPRRENSPAAEPKRGAVQLLRGASIKPEPLDWLWLGWLVRGKFHVLGGAPGTGKTTIAIGLAATISIGGRWPDGSHAPAGNVVIWSGEDDPKDTLAPRLIAAGADMERVFFVGDVFEAGQTRSFDPARDVGPLQDAIKAAGGCALLIVDPIVSAVAGDSHKNAEVRRALQPLVDLAASAGAALLGITHFTKNTAGREPVERLTGSLAFGALARVVFIAAKKPTESSKELSTRVFMRAKSNIGPDGGGFAYGLAQIPLDGHPGVAASCVEWGSRIEGTAREVLQDVENPEQHNDGAGAEAKQFLRDLLRDGPVAAADIKKHCNNAGLSWSTIKRVKKTLGIIAQKTGFGSDAEWRWAFPDGRGPKDVEGAQQKSWSPSAPLQDVVSFVDTPIDRRGPKNIEGAEEDQENCWASSHGVDPFDDDSDAVEVKI